MNRKNFKSSFKRFLDNGNDNPTVGTFDLLEEEGKVEEAYIDEGVEPSLVDEYNETKGDLPTYIGEDNNMMENEYNNEPVAKEVSIISKGLVLEGNINTEGDLDIKGDINGNINAEGIVRIYGVVNGDIKAKQVICDGGIVRGNNVTAVENIEVKQGSEINSECHCVDIIVDGKIEGDFKLTGKCLLKPNAHYSGNIVTEDLVIEPGAKFAGTVSN